MNCRMHLHVVVYSVEPSYVEITRVDERYANLAEREYRRDKTNDTKDRQTEREEKEYTRSARVRRWKRKKKPAAGLANRLRSSSSAATATELKPKPTTRV